MDDEKQEESTEDWFGQVAEPDLSRGYRPSAGPDEPEEAPPGRASASLSESTVPADDGTKPGPQGGASSGT